MKKIGIIGTGQIAQAHLKKWQEIDEIQVEAVCDIDETALNRTAETYGIPQKLKDFRELLNLKELDAVDVCLHNNFHAPVTIAALEAGKHVYCEKPIAGSFADGLAMVQAAQSTGKMLHIQLARLYEECTKAAKMLIDEGELGHIYHARATEYRRRGRPYVDGYGTSRFVQKAQSGGGALYDTGIYEISRMLYLLGNPRVERVTGKTYQELDMDKERAKEYDVEEFATGTVYFEGGLTLDIVSSWAINLDRFAPSYIAGSQGGLKVDPFKFFKNIAQIDFDMETDLGSIAGRRRLMTPQLFTDMSSSQHHWAAVLHGRMDLLPTADLALNTMLIQQGIYLSSDRNSEVSAEEIKKASASTAVKL
jgi:predicted dehydrogenase